MADPVGQPQRFSRVAERAVRISARPRGKSREIEATDTGVVPAVNRCVDAVTFSIVLLEPLTSMELCGFELPCPIQARPQRMMGLEEKDGISQLSGQAEELIPEVSRLSIEPPIETDVPLPPERWEEPRSIVETHTQLSRGDVCGFFFGGAVPMHGPEAGAELEANVEFFAQRFWAVGQLLARGQGLLENRDRLSVRRPRLSLRAGLTEILQSLVPDLRLAEVGADRQRQVFQLTRTECFEGFGHSAVTELALRRKNLFLDNCPDPFMTESESRAYLPQDAAAHKFLDSLRSQALVQTACPVE
jgi:hypothetical protein